MFMDARRSTLPLIRSRPLAVALPAPFLVDVVVSAEVRVVEVRQRGDKARAAGAAVRAVLVVAAADLQHLLQPADPPFRVCKSSMPCLQPASIRIRSSACVVRAIR